MAIYLSNGTDRANSQFFTPAWLDTHAASASAAALFERHGVSFFGRYGQAFRIRSAAFPTMFIAHITTPPARLRWERSGANAHRHLFMFVNKGSIEISDSAQSLVTDGDGLCVLLAGSGTAEFSMLTTTELLLFAFDSHEADPIDIAAARDSDISSRSTVFRAAYAFLLAVLDNQGQDEPPLTEALQVLTHNIVRALVNDTGHYPRGSSGFAMAQKRLMAYAPIVTFTPDDLAERLKISRRTLSRWYNAEGLSVTQELRRFRVARAQELLASGQTMSMTQIAEASGFGSDDTLTRAFQKELGETPAGYRERIAAEAAAGQGASDGTDPDATPSAP